MRTWRARYVVSIFIRAGEDDPMDGEETKGRKELAAVVDDLEHELIALDETAGIGIHGELSGLIDCEDVTGGEGDPFVELDEEGA